MDQFALDGVKAWNSRLKPNYSAITVRPLTNTIGAEVFGIDLAQPVSDAQMAELRTALNDNMVLVFRDQVLTQEQHKHFGTRWGEIHCHPVRLAQGVPNPEITVVRNDSTSLVAIGEGWHSDSTFEERPPMGSLLYMKQMPETGAYDTLSPTMQTFLDGLTALHNGEVLSRLYNFPVPPGGYPETRHPLVARHPETGRKLLYVNPSFTARIPELSLTESTALLDMLYRHVESSPAIVCRVRWSDNTLVFWDNRCTQHHAIFDYAPYAREGERVTVLGERPHA
jgi:taurine dioxygenase